MLLFLLYGLNWLATYLNASDEALFSPKNPGFPKRWRLSGLMGG